MTVLLGCAEEVAVPLRGRDIRVIRQGLELLLASSTRHEHVYHDIHAALGRLPDVRGQGNPAHACCGGNGACECGSHAEGDPVLDT